MDAARRPRRGSRATLACHCLPQVLQNNLVVLTHALQDRQGLDLTEHGPGQMEQQRETLPWVARICVQLVCCGCSCAQSDGEAVQHNGLAQRGAHAQRMAD